MTRLVLFDCDGTLVDSQHLIVATMDEAFQLCGRTPPSRQQTLSIVGLSLAEAMTELVPSAKPFEIRRLVDAYREGASRVRASGVEDTLYDGAAEAVTALARAGGTSLGVATGKSHRGVVRLFDHHGWHDHFATIQTADNNPSKPHPGMIVSAMSETGAVPETTVMIGDTSYDMAMARAAGCRAIGVTWGYHAEADLVRAGAHDIVRDYAELRRRLAQHFDLEDLAP